MATPRDLGAILRNRLLELNKGQAPEIPRVHLYEDPRKKAYDAAQQAKWQFDPTIPESSMFSPKAFAAAFLSSDLDSQKKMLENWGVEISQDSYGNPVIVRDGKPAYINKPGPSSSDARDFVADMIAYLPAAKLVGMAAKPVSRALTAVGAGVGTEYVRDYLGDKAKGEDVNFENISNLGTGLTLGVGQVVGEIITAVARGAASTIAKPKLTGDRTKKHDKSDKAPRIGPVYKTTSPEVKKSTGRVYEFTRGVKNRLIDAGIDPDEFSDEAILKLNDIVQNSPGLVDRATARSALSDIPMTNLQGSIDENVLGYDPVKQMDAITKLKYSQEARLGTYGKDIQEKFNRIDEQQLKSVDDLIAELAGTEFFRDQIVKREAVARRTGDDYKFSPEEMKILQQSEHYEPRQSPKNLIKDQATQYRTELPRKRDTERMQQYEAMINKVFTNKRMKTEDFEQLSSAIEDVVNRLGQAIPRGKGKGRGLYDRNVANSEYDYLFRSVLQNLDSLKEPLPDFSSSVKVQQVVALLKKSRSRYNRSSMQVAEELADRPLDAEDLDVVGFTDELFNANKVLNKKATEKLYERLQQNLVGAVAYVRTPLDKRSTRVEDYTPFYESFAESPLAGSTVSDAIGALREQVLRKTIYPPQLLKQVQSPTNAASAAQQLKLIADHMNATLETSMPVLKAVYGFQSRAGDRGSDLIEDRIRRLAADLDSVAKANYGNWNQTQQTNFKKKVKAAFTNFSDLRRFAAPTQAEKTKTQEVLDTIGTAAYRLAIGGVLGVGATAALNAPDFVIASVGTGTALGSNMLLSPKSLLGSKLSKILEQSTATNIADSMIEGSAPFTRSMSPYARRGVIPTGIRAATMAGGERGYSHAFEDNTLDTWLGIGKGVGKVGMFVLPYAATTRGAVYGAKKTKSGISKGAKATS